MMKGSVLIISRMKDTRKICSQMLPWGAKGVGFRADGREGALGWGWAEERDKLSQWEVGG